MVYDGRQNNGATVARTYVNGSAAIQETFAAGRQHATRSEECWREAEDATVPSPLGQLYHNRITLDSRIADCAGCWAKIPAFLSGRSLDMAGGGVMLRWFVTCESGAGFGRRRGPFASSVAATLSGLAALDKVSCLRLPLISLAPSAPGRAFVPKSRLRGPHYVLGSGAAPCMPGRRPWPALLWKSRC